MDHTNKDYVIIIGGATLTMPMYRFARESLGLGIIAFDRNMDAPGMRYADIACDVDTRDWRGAAKKAQELARSHLIKGVITCGADVEVSVSAVAEALGLRAVPLEVAMRCNDKVAMHQYLDGISFTAKPRYRVAESLSEAEAAADALGFPLFIKPVDNCASRGVQRLEHREELAAAYAMAESFCLNNRQILLEQSLDGTKHTVEMIVYNGKWHLLSIIDTHYISKKWPCESGLNTTLLSPDMQKRAFAFAQNVARSMGIDFGAHKVDISINAAGEIGLIELTARLSGGFHCQYASPLAYGSNDILAALKLAVGMDLDMDDIVHRWERGAAVQAVFPQPGRVVSIEGEAEARALPGVAEIVLMCKPGDVVGPYLHSAARPAFVIASGETTEEAVANAQRGAARLFIHTEEVR